jgi:hypothetical protein
MRSAAWSSAIARVSLAITGIARLEQNGTLFAFTAITSSHAA